MRNRLSAALAMVVVVVVAVNGFLYFGYYSYRTATMTPDPAETSTRATKNTSVEPATATIPATALDKAVDAGISETTLTRGAIIADFNNDGRRDISQIRRTPMLLMASTTGHKAVFLSGAQDFRELANGVDLHIILTHVYRQTSQAIFLLYSCMVGV